MIRLWEQAFSQATTFSKLLYNICILLKRKKKPHMPLSSSSKLRILHISSKKEDSTQLKKL